MFPYPDAQSRLDLHHERAAEMARLATEHRLAREVSHGRHRRFGRWPRRHADGRALRVAVAP